MSGFCGEPTLVNRVAREDAHEGCGSEETGENGNEGVIDKARYTRGWQVHISEKVSIDAAERQLAKHQRKLSEDLNKPEHLLILEFSMPKRPA